jgi:hypothetical protein
MQATKIRKKNFSSFNEAEAMKLLGIKHLQKWKLELEPFTISDFFYERLRRLDRFGTKMSEGGKGLLIEAFCEEALEQHKKIKLWKQVHLESENLTGIPDYLATESIDYFEKPFLCAVEAKKDDFEKGLAQCLAEMKACQENNDKSIDIFGIVSNGTSWVFYKLTTANQVYQSATYSTANMGDVLAGLAYIFGECEKNL